MKKLLVICGAGMTSSVLVSSMREAASKLPETEYRIGSCSLAQIEKYVPQADIVFLAPHLSYMEKDMRRKYPETPVFLIPAKTYSEVNGQGVLDLLKQKETVRSESLLSSAASRIAGRNSLRSLTLASSSMMMVLVTGGVFVVIHNFPYQPYLDLIKGTRVDALLSAVEGLTINCIAVYMAFLMGWHYGEKNGLSPGHAALNSLVSFFILLHIQNGSLDLTYLGTRGLFCAMITAFVSVRIFKLTRNVSLRLFRPLQTVPRPIRESFLSIVPMFCSVLLFMTITAVFAMSDYHSFPAFIYETLQSAISSLMGRNLFSIQLSMLFINLFWYFGIHGGQVVGSVTKPILLPLSMENIAAKQAGVPLPNIIHSQFFVLCTFGGAGSTLGLAFLMAFFAKSVHLKQLGRISLPMGIFYINEPIILGLMMLNPAMLMPFIMVPQISIVLTYLVTAFGIVPPSIGIELPFTTPPLISGLIQGGWRLALWQLVLLLIQTALWYPFFRRQDRKYLEEESVRNSAVKDGN